MSQVYWLNAVNGSFTNPSDWSGGMVPGASDAAILDAVGSAFTVTSGVSETVESIQLASNATLSLTAGTFTAIAGTGAGANAGIILVGAGATFATTGTLTNTGTIALYGSGRGKTGASLVFTGSTTLAGGGVVLLEGQGHNTIGRLPKKQRSILYNVDNTIMGSGTIAAELTVLNEQGGTVDANGVSALVVYGQIGENAGLVEATGAGGLIFENTIMESSASGVVLAGAGSEVQLVQSVLIGGTLKAIGSGKIVAEGATIESQAANDPVIIDANVNVIGGCAFAGTIENNGTISGYPSGSEFEIIANAVTLEGNGDLELGGHGHGMTGEGLTLASGTISGKGVIIGPEKGASFLLAIGAAGVVDGNAKRRLVLDTYTSIVNGGLIECTGAGGVLVKDAIVNSGTLSVERGAFEVEGAVSGAGVAIVGGGTLAFLSSFDEAVTFTGKTGTLELARSQEFTNSVKGFSTKGQTTLELADIGFVGASEATFSGTASGGVLTVTDGTHTANINLKGDYLSSTFVASSDGHGGVSVATQTPETTAVPPHIFISAMASLGVSAGGAIHAGETGYGRAPMLASPRVMMA